METRRARIKLWYEGKNITDDIAPDLKGFSYTENASGSADDINIELKDDAGKWISAWAPTKGDLIKPTMMTTNWRYEGDSQHLACGAFLIDEPRYSGRPRTLNLGAIATPADTGFMTIEKSYTWQKATIEQIARTIADTAGIGLVFDSSVNPLIHFIEQSETPDGSFLFNLCQDNGLAMKLYNQKMVIFNEAEYEGQEVVATIRESDTIRWDARDSWTDTGYDGCKIAYTHPKTGKTLAYTFKPSGKTGSKLYQLNETADSLAEAQRKAQAKLRELNKNEHTMALELPGNLNWFASQTVQIEDFGKFDGKYYIDRISRRIGGGFTMSIEIHQVLEGY